MYCLTRVVREPFDTDGWWHLRDGRWILDHRTLPRVDVFSWTAHGEPWRLNAWLTDAILGAVDRVTPVRPLMSIAMFAALAALAALAYTSARRAGARPWPAAGAAMVVEYLLTPYAFERPQMISYVLFAIVVLLLPPALAHSNRAFAGIVALVVLWANLHLAFSIGVIVIAASAVGQLIVTRKIVRPAGLVAAVVVAGLCTPYGPGGYAAAFAVRTSSRIVVEWQRASLHEVRDLLIGGFALAAWFAAIRTRRVRQPQIALPLLAGSLAFADAIRNGPFLLLLAAPEVALGITAVRAPRMRRALASRVRPIRDGAFVGVFVLLAASAISIDRVRPVDPTIYPVRSTAALRRFPTAGCRLLNEYDQGGYLLAELGPTVRVSEDGRNDLYGEARIIEQQRVLRGRPGAVRWLNRHGVGCVLVRPDRRLRAILTERGWRVLARDPSAVLLQRPARR